MDKQGVWVLRWPVRGESCIALRGEQPHHFPKAALWQPFIMVASLLNFNDTILSTS